MPATHDPREPASPARPDPELASSVRTLLDRVIGPAPFGFALYDADFCYLMINETLAALNGRPVEDHLGRSVRDMAPDLADQVTALLRQVLTTGEPILDTEVVGETEGEPGRRGIWVNSFYRVTDPDGSLVGVAALARDVTEERRLQQQAAAGQFRAAFDASLEPAIMVAAVPDARGTLDLRVDYVNPAAAELTGLSLADAIGHRLEDVFPAVEQLGLSQEYRRVFQTGVPYLARNLAYSSVRADGEVPGRVDISVTRTPGGLLIMWRDSELEHRLLEQQVALQAERSRVWQLQRSFLPRRLPQAQGAALAARYRSAERDAPLGGDWYDALHLEGELVLCIGDVAGHGMSAVETMGVARITTRAFIAEDRSPDVVLSRIDRYARLMTAGAEERPIMTMIAATYDPRTRLFRWSNAGHPPPLLVDPDGARLLPSHPHPPIGLGRQDHQAHEVTLAPATTIVLYTDGLIERRGENLDEGLARLVEAASDLPDDPGAACEVLLQRCVPKSHDDDVCLVALHAEARTIAPPTRRRRVTG